MNEKQAPSELPLVAEESTKDQLKSAKTGSKKLNWETFKTVSVILISVFALFISLYQTKILVQQNSLSTEVAKAQLWPRIEIDFGGIFDSEQGCKQATLELKNVGIGPAIINSFQIAYQNKSYDGWWMLCREIADPGVLDGGNFSFTNRVPINQVIQAGETLVLFSLAAEDHLPFQSLFDVLFSAEGPELAICYSSVFDDHWQIGGGMDETLLPQQQATCE